MSAAKSSRPVGPVWARGADQEQRRPLDRESIVSTGIAIADADGLDAVSIRRVASELAARPMSLYRHVESKDDLLDLMFDALAAEAVLGDDLPRGWRSGLTAIARRSRDLGLAHPWASELLGRRAPLGPNTLRVLDEWMRALTPLRLSPERAWAIATSVNDYVVGYTTRVAAVRRALPADPDQAARWQRATDSYLSEQAGSGAYPHLGALLTSGYDGQGDSFEVGLTLLLDAIGRTHSRSRSR